MKHTEDFRQLVLSYFPGQALPGDVVEGVIKYVVTSVCLSHSKLVCTDRCPVLICLFHFFEVLP